MFKKLSKSDEPFWRYLFAKVFFVIRFHGNRQMFDQRKYVFLLYFILFFVYVPKFIEKSFQKSLTWVKHHLKLFVTTEKTERKLLAALC